MAFRHFNHLNVPDSWERYFTKYPQGMSILEALFDWVSQVDSMVDNQNKLNDNVEQFRNEIDAFVERFDKRLQDEVTQTLSDWQNSGFLDVVISSALQWELDNYITTNEQDKLSIAAQLQQDAINVKKHGAVGDGITDDTAAFDHSLTLGNNIIMPTGDYAMTKFQGHPMKVVDGRGSTIKLTLGPSPVLVGFHDNTIYKNITFECMESNLPQARASLQNRQNVILYNCTFKGFRDPVTSNAWGLYLKDCENIQIINCRFGDNTQSDIAILEGSKNIKVINAMGLTKDTFPVINIEPNVSSRPIENIIIESSTLERLYLLENVNAYSTKNMVVSGCTIKELVYDGSAVSFIGSRILSARNAPTNNFIFAGQLQLNDSLGVGENLLPDNRLLSLSRTDVASNWTVQYFTTPLTSLYRRQSDRSIGRYLRLNPEHASGVVHIRPKERTQVSGGESYLLALTGRAVYNADAGFMGRNARVRFYGADDTLITTQDIYIFKGDQGEVTPVMTEVALLTVPQNASSMEILIGLFNSSSNRVDLVSITLHKVLYNQRAMGHSNTLYSLHTLKNGQLETVISEEPDLVNNRYYANLSKGDKWLLENPQPSGYLGYVCTDDTQTKPVMKGFGMIEG